MMPNNTNLISVPLTSDGLASAKSEAHRRYARMVNFKKVKKELEKDYQTKVDIVHYRDKIAMYCSLPIASFRPCRYQQRPCNSDCLPPGRVTPACRRLGLPAMPGKQKKEASLNDASFFYLNIGKVINV